MPDYHFYEKGKQIVVLERSEENTSIQLLNQGYEKQFEEISAPSKKSALTRLSEIRRDNRIDQRNFLAGVGMMPLMGILTSAAVFLLRKKSFSSDQAGSSLKADMLATALWLINRL